MWCHVALNLSEFEMKDLADIVRDNDAAHAEYAECARAYRVAVADVAALAHAFAPRHSVAHDDGPRSVSELTRQWTGRMWLTVSGANSDTAIYDAPRDNSAMRAWHDLTHVLMGIGYSLDDEREVALAQQRAAGIYLRDVRSLAPEPFENALAVLWFDTYGQSVFCATHGAFPSDQRAFVKACWGAYYVQRHRDQTYACAIGVRCGVALRAGL